MYLEAVEIGGKYAFLIEFLVVEVFKLHFGMVSAR